MHVAVPPEIELALVVRAPGYAQRSLTVHAPASGLELHETIELSPEAAGELVVELPGLPPGTEVGFGFFLLDREGDYPDVQRDLVSEDATFRFADIPAGRYRVVARPGGTFYWRRGHYLDLEFETELLPGRTVQHIEPAVLGGRVEMAVETREGAPLQPRCSIRDEAGHELTVQFVGYHEHGKASSSWKLMGPDTTEVDRALAAGSYTAVFTLAGYGQETTPFVIEPGRMTRLNVVLRPE